MELGVTVSQTENNPPSTPILKGPSGTLKPGIWYTFYCNSTDPDGDDVYYMWDWEGGRPYTNWLGPYPSNEIQEFTHSFPDLGEFEVRCKAKDEHGAESDWSMLPITVPKTVVENQQQGTVPSQSTQQAQSVPSQYISGTATIITSTTTTAEIEAIITGEVNTN